MSEDEDYEGDFEEYQYAPDPKTQELKGPLLELFSRNASAVYYQRQLEVRYEKDYFHWVTDRALKELVEEDKIRSEYSPIMVGDHKDKIRIFTISGNRYFRRTARQVAKLVEEYSDPSITVDVGLFGQELFKVAYARYGYHLIKEDAREFGGKTWNESKKNLDFIVEKEGTHFGCEVKNTLGYMDKKELNEKMRMCKYFGITPILIMRRSPSVWNDEIIGKGGFIQIFETQIFPPGRTGLVNKMRENLGLPVLVSAKIPDSIMERLDKTLKKRGLI